MKIGFDISDLVTDRADGTTRYTRELVRRLPGVMSEHEWLLFAPGKPRGDWQLATDNCQLIASPWPRFWTQSRLWWDLYRYRPDVLLMPIQQLPYVRPRRMKTVAVVHDLAFHEFGEHFTYKDWVLQHVFTAYAVREANQLVAVSQSTADDVARLYGRSEGVHVVHHGLDHEKFREPTAREREESWQILRRAYPTLRKPYVLYVGQIQPRKNLERLVEAFEEVVEDGGSLSPTPTPVERGAAPDEFAGARTSGVPAPAQLVIAGGYGWLQRPILERVERSAARERILMLGRVPDALLPALYWHAAVFVMPSLYEGFGMPLVEAMACGCPVVTSNVSSMPEVVGEAGVVVDPRSTRSLAGGIRLALSRRGELREKGLRRAAEFSWADAVARVNQILVS